MCTACFTGKYPIELPSEERRGKSLFDSEEKGKGGPLAGKAAEVTVERPVPSKPEHAEAVSIETREGTETLETKFNPSAVQVAADDAGMGMCSPGPDADLEGLLTEADRIPASSSATATPKES